MAPSEQLKLFDADWKSAQTRRAQGPLRANNGRAARAQQIMPYAAKARTGLKPGQ